MSQSDLDRLLIIDIMLINIIIQFSLNDLYLLIISCLSVHALGKLKICRLQIHVFHLHSLNYEVAMRIV